MRTKKIKLGSTVTVLSSDDPVRVFQDFATLDLISSGRAEIVAGRGSFIESFPLFGYDLHDYSKLFAEKLESLQLSVGTLPHKQLMHALELYGTKVAPAVRAELEKQLV